MPEQKPVEIYQLRFFLKGISPLIWRRLLMASDTKIRRHIKSKSAATPFDQLYR